MCVHKSKVLAVETIWGSLRSNIMHLLMLSVIFFFNIPQVLPKIKKLAWKCTAKSWVLDEHGPGLGRRLWGHHVRAVVRHVGFGVGCGPCSACVLLGQRCPQEGADPHGSSLRQVKKPYR